ncbi:triose-phosphate isomerase [Solitalea koreensis]|uniref:Triosephosphate isomerase n=1 Tax=Solitalea koreensis TaxID=543615 RepID=A0A521DPZ9_9SPHI|nr:triose-phosphate isomerase [Solitalea koreensis]SMO73708.1 triosephosphate isomerase [Solitalea koreensis]
MRQKIVAGNWKMNNDLQESLKLFTEVQNMVADEVNNDATVIIASPFISIYSLDQLKTGSAVDGKIKLAAQNCAWEESGAFTGEISAKMIRSAGADYVILGHSERRQYFKESNQMLAKKVDIALSNELIPIFCIGETLEERETNTHFEVIKNQLKEGLFHLIKTVLKTVVIAYEPVWAIGTGLTATPQQAQEIHSFIRSIIAEGYDEETAEEVSILYGGSCNPKNAHDLFSQPDIDGGLIGGASLKSRDFTDIIKAYNA